MSVEYIAMGFLFSLKKKKKEEKKEEEGRKLPKLLGPFSVIVIITTKIVKFTSR